MLTLPPLPSKVSDINLLCDWMELKAISTKYASAADLERGLNRANADNKNSQQIEELCAAVFIELSDRKESAGQAYPFSVFDSGKIQYRGPISDYIPYIFCLAIAFYGGEQPPFHSGLNPRILFEELCCLATSKYVLGDIYHFGAGKKGRKGFREAVEKLCGLIGEGSGFKDSGGKPQDDHVDLVAWKHFQDEKPGKIVLFGQCASGKNWEEKIFELNPEAFWDLWMQEAGASKRQLLKSLYIPFRVNATDWNYSSAYGGILFDRCRIASLLGSHNLRDARFRAWIIQAFRKNRLTYT
jgi:hypothetical protein